MKVIAYSNPNGLVSIVNPASQASVVQDFLRSGNPTMAATIQAVTYDQFIEWIRQKDVPVTITNPPAGTPAMMLRADAEKLDLSFTETISQVINKTDIPADRSIRNLWRLRKNSNPQTGYSIQTTESLKG